MLCVSLVIQEQPNALCFTGDPTTILCFMIHLRSKNSLMQLHSVDLLNMMLQSVVAELPPATSIPGKQKGM